MSAIRRRVERQCIAACVPVAVACSLVLALAASLDAQAGVRQGGELAYGESSPIGHLHPYASIAHNGPTDRVLSMIYEPLFRFNFNKEEWENVLATAIEPIQASKGKSAFLLTLRTAKWHDGTSFKAADVIFTYDYIRHASANQLEQKRFAALIADVREGALPSQVIVEFNETVADARYHLLDFIIPASRFVRPSYAPAPGEKTLDEFPIGTGPYKFVGYAAGNPTLAVYDSYHSGRGNLATVRSREFSDLTSMVQTLNTLRGDINLIVEVPGDMLATVEGNGGNTISQVESYNVYAIALRQKPGSMLASLKVRRALTMAVDRPQLLKNWFAGKGQVLASPVVPRAPFYDASIKYLPFDSAQARRDLAQESATGRRLNFIYPVGESGADTRTTNAVRSIRDALEAVGIRVDEKPLRPAQFEKALFETGEFDMAWVRWEFNPAYDITPFFVSSQARAQGMNYMNFVDADVDRLSKDYGEATDPSLRQALMRSLQKLLNEKAPAIFLVNEEKSYAYRSQVRIPVGAVDPFHFFTYVSQWWLRLSAAR